MKIELIAGSDPLAMALQSTTSDASGSYQFCGVSPETYTIKAYGPSAAYIGWVGVTTVADGRDRNVDLPKLMTLVAPPNGATAHTSHPTLTWEALAEAETYIVQLNRTSDFALVEPPRRLSGTSYTVGPELTVGTSYTWQVDAIRGSHSVGTTLAAFTFSVGTACGNGRLDPGEQCDDGNNNAGDCCSPDCQLPSTRGTKVPEAVWNGSPASAICGGSNGTRHIADVTDGAGNRFDLECMIDTSGGNIVLMYSANHQAVGMGVWSGTEINPTANVWSVYWVNDAVFNCFTASEWTSAEPKDAPLEACAADCSGNYCQWFGGAAPPSGQCNEPNWVTFDFDALTGHSGATPAPSPPAQGSSASPVLGLTLRAFVSNDGPGGAAGDALIRKFVNPESALAFLPPNGAHLSATYRGLSCDNNGDGICDEQDLDLVTSAIDTCEGDSGYNEPADADRDGCVTVQDRQSLFCVGDCEIDGSVTVDEILRMVNAALGGGGVADCAVGDGNHDGEITVDEVLAAVNHALTGCSGA